MVNSTTDSPVELASFTSYPDAGYNHSGWVNDDGTVYAMQDENHGYDVKILDISDYSNISVLATFSSGVDPNSMAHNGIIKGDLLYIAYYHDGLRVFDISNPSNPIQVNSYDTYLPNNHISYRGAWHKQLDILQALARAYTLEFEEMWEVMEFIIQIYR